MWWALRHGSRLAQRQEGLKPPPEDLLPSGPRSSPGTETGLELRVCAPRCSLRAGVILNPLAQCPGLMGNSGSSQRLRQALHCIKARVTGPSTWRQTRRQVGGAQQRAGRWNGLEHLKRMLSANVASVRFRLKRVCDALSSMLQSGDPPRRRQISRGAPAQRPPGLEVQARVSPPPSLVNEGLLEHGLTAALHSWLSPGHGAELTTEETRNVDSGFLQKSLLHRTEGVLFVRTTVLRVTEGSSHATDVCPHLFPVPAAWRSTLTPLPCCWGPQKVGLGGEVSVSVMQVRNCDRPSVLRQPTWMDDQVLSSERQAFTPPTFPTIQQSLIGANTLHHLPQAEPTVRLLFPQRFPKMRPHPTQLVTHPAPAASNFLRILATAST